RPQNGSMILYNRKKVKYRKDGYCWKKRKDGKTTREDHMKLKVQGVEETSDSQTQQSCHLWWDWEQSPFLSSPPSVWLKPRECLYGCYVHSSIIPTFHRRCYWLLQNPDIVLVHYLNVPAIEDCGKPCGPILCSINTDKKEWAKWTKEELIGQLKPMFHGIKWTCSNGNSSTGFSVEQLVQQILDSHQTKPPPRTHNCLCTGTLGAGSSVHHKCNSAKHRIISPKVEPRAGAGYSSAHSEPDTTQNSPVSISSGLNSDPDMADSPVVTGMSHVASVMSSLSQSAAVFMSEVTGDPIYSMSPTGGPNAHLMGPDAASQGLVLAVASDSHKFAFPGSGAGGSGGTGASEGLAMLSAPGVSEELVLSSSLDSSGIKLPETTVNFDPDCFLNNPKQGQTYGGSGLKGEAGSSGTSSSSSVGPSSSSSNGGLRRSPPVSDSGAPSPSRLPAHCCPPGAGSAPAPPWSRWTSAPLTPSRTTPRPRCPGGTGRPCPAPTWPIRAARPASSCRSPLRPPRSPAAGSLAYMHVAEVVSAAVAQGALGMLQATGRLFMVTDYSPEWSYPERSHAITRDHTRSHAGVLNGPWVQSAGARFSCNVTFFQAGSKGTGTGLFHAEEGGVKVLITGPWQEASSSYSCLFDQISVPASLIQPGVLRCYCPAHDTGLVTLQVAVNNQIISNSVVFEYKARALPSLPSSQHDWLSLDVAAPALRNEHVFGFQNHGMSGQRFALSSEPALLTRARERAKAPARDRDQIEDGSSYNRHDNQFRMSILERLEQMERRMAEMSGHHQQGAGGTTGGTGGGAGGNTSQTQCMSGQGPAGSSFESRVVVVCEKMMSRACWAKSKHLIHSKTFRGMTLLHLAAAQGYATLIQTLIKWRSKHADSIDLELEVDPLNVDHFSCTPLMWACALGHMEAAVVLYKWDRRALAIPDSLGRLPLSIARSRGHTKLAECLEQLQRDEQQQQQPPSALPPAPRMAFSPAPDTPAPDSWMVAWGSDTVAAAPGQKGSGAGATTNPSPDLRRPRSEPSSYYSSECQRDLPLAKKHKPNPEFFQGRPDKAMELYSAAAVTLGAVAVGRKGAGAGGGSSLGKEKLASRLRQREPLSVLMMSEREMVDTELLSYRDELENQDCLTHMDDLQVNMMTLAEHIIEATPERIKRENFVAVETTPLDSAGVSNTMSWLASYLGDVEHLPSVIHLRSLYSEPLTPSSNPSLSPAGSPLREGPFEKPSLPSPADWTDFLSASNSKVERDLAQLTLSDPEQRELYEAARLVQTAFRKYKGRPLREQQEVAAAVIQRCYRKYKQLTWIALKYALYKKMTQAAILIQSKFRSYHEQKKFQQSRRAAVLIQQYYRSYKEFGRLRPHRRAAAAALVQHKLRLTMCICSRSSLLTKKQDQAARKIMRFLRRCRHR
ncbi:CMTA1 protein, partial [Atractosteus spatula]|nr:CMTA1 protein [Atractosteus spatula]